jgi:PilZ domain
MTAGTQPEKRAARRFALEVPVAIRRNGNTDVSENAQVRDVSARGICLFLDAPIQQGSPIAFTLTLPPEITLTENIRVQCKGKIVRTEPGAREGKIAAAAVIEEYEFLPGA